MLNNKERFAGDKKISFSLFGHWEKKLADYLVIRVPCGIETYHLTVSTVLWSGLIIVFSYLAQNNIHWMWLTSLMIICQYFTDVLDGAVGRLRRTGLIRWGYYMDHFLDYIFLCSILIGYAFLFNDEYNSLFFILAVCGGFMVNSYLSFAATNQFKTEYLKVGPTEVRLIFVIINTLLIIFHKTYLAGALPYVLVFSVLGLIYVVYATQKKIWREDMEEKKLQSPTKKPF